MKSKLEQNIFNRDEIISTLKQELIGPIEINKDKMVGLKINFSGVNNIYYSSNKEHKRKFYYNSENSEEIIQNGNTPITQYSAGIVFPYKQSNIDIEDQDVNTPQAQFIDDHGSIIDQEGIQVIQNRSKDNETTDVSETNDFVMNDKLPSSFAYTFYVATYDDLLSLEFNIRGGTYKPFEVLLLDKEKPNKEGYSTKWWAREKIIFNSRFIDLIQINNHHYKKRFAIESLQIELQLHIRQIEKVSSKGYFVTASVTNHSIDQPIFYKNALFQSSLETNFYNNKSFSPYPTTLSIGSLTSDEEMSNELLYYSNNTYALGHGCSVEWDEEAKRISSTFIPEHEITNITPDIKDENGNELKISMLDLAEKPLDEVQRLLKMITGSYQQWIDKKRLEIANLPIELRDTANNHLNECSYSLSRMDRGIALLEDEKIFKAFQLSNLAMFIQQVSGGEIIEGIVNNGKVSYPTDHTVLTSLKPISELRANYQSGNKGSWRAFQIAFLIMSLPSLPKNNFEERAIADLIWFPTGGGKTEAYLGYAASSILYNRLVNPNDNGTDVIMRYTLRLLTADQFQRSARLICALELIRQSNKDKLGLEEISIGLWVGKSNTPNKVKNALEQLKEWKNTGHKKHEFLITHCPLCRSKMFRYETNSKYKGNHMCEVAGYKSITKRGGNDEFVIHCPNNNCTFSNHLPIYLIDEQLYEKKPTFIIGTVDKFAMLAWAPMAKSLFGLNQDGKRILSPPSLIIQDEMHLISGPLGSTVGIYESLIEELCTDYRFNVVTKPKIICATATVTGYKKQILALFNKAENNVKIFPSPGLSHDDSFFAQTHYIQDKLDGKRTPSKGRKYIGLASNLIGTQQLQVKIYTTLLQKVKELEAPDPYWTLLSFYNSIRELGGSLTLFQTDISNYILQYLSKHYKQGDIRYINNIKELTSRLENREVTDALAELKTSFDNPKSIDICLASNIIEVGVDVERLSLMTILGQPKNTAQYIQVSGRVGRAWYERPGLVLTIYKLNMSRDKSHFEHFKEYHQSLYKHVEATSLTPFSEPSIDRALSGVIIGWLRQFGDSNLANNPHTIKEFSYLFDDIYEKMLQRIINIEDNPRSIEYFKNKFEEIKELLLSGSATLWSQKLNSNDYFYMYTYGTYVPYEYKKFATPVLTSMRNVDASCQGTISNIFNT